MQEILETVLRDREFYEESGGGLTISGGEPLMQPEFTTELAKAAKAEGLHVCVETSGFCPEADIAELAKWVDLFLYDEKLGDDAKHRLYTGVSNRQILKNLETLNHLGAGVILRCPLIDGVNLTPEHFAHIAAVVNQLQNIRAVNLELYHPLGISKRASLGMEAADIPADFLSREKAEGYAQILEQQVTVPVSIL